MAAQRLGLDKVPVHIATGLTPQQVKAYRLADNRVAAEAEWDENLLALELGELNDGGYDLGVTGFNPAELDKLLREGGDVEGEDEVPEKPEEPISKPGDLWLLDDHRVICGDATDAAALGALVNGHKAGLIFTDPPYNVNYKQGGPYGSARKQSNKCRSIQNDNMSDAECEQFLVAAFSNWLGVIKPGAAVYICCSDKAMPEFRRAFTEAGFKWSSNVVWAKNNFSLSRADYHPQHEPIIYGWSEGAKHYWCGRRDVGTVWNIDKPRANDLHPTMKPVSLIVRAIENSSKMGDVVLDTFGGSGSTLIACKQTARTAMLSELDPGYVDVIVKRWENYTGKKARRVG